MKLFYLIFVAVFSLEIANAQVYNQSVFRSNIHAVILAEDGDIGSIRTLTEDDPIIETYSISPRAVKLNGNVTLGSVGSAVDLKEGDILFGRYDQTIWTYCGYYNLTAESRAATAATMGILTAGFTLLLEPFMEYGTLVCLYDANDDGVFDAAWESVANGGQQANVAFMLTKKSMSDPVPYERVSATEGPRVKVDLIWSKANNRGLLTFIQRYGGKNIRTVNVYVPTEGDEPVEVKINSVNLLIHAYDNSAKTIDVEITSGFSNVYERIPTVYTIVQGY